MKNKKITILLIIINIILMGIICSLISKNGNIVKEKQIIKEMTETEYDNSINTLNKSHEEYAKKVQSYKVKLATAITNQGVETSENATIDEMTANIEKILQSKNGITDIFISSKGTGQSETNKITYTIPEEYYGKKALVFFSYSYDAGSNSTSYSLTTSGLTIEKTYLNTSHSNTNSITFGYVKVLTGTLQNGTIVASSNGWDRELKVLTIVIL